MTHVKLPAGYEDWVEVSPEPMGECVKVEVIHWSPMIGGGRGGTPIEKIRYFVPPRPKPTLPDVKPGAVIRFKSKTGSMRRAIRGRTGWRVFEQGIPVVYYGVDFAEHLSGGHDLLNDVDDNGFLVELEGL